MKSITSFWLFLFVLIFTSCSIIRYPGDRRDYPDDRNERKDKDWDKDGRSYPFSRLGIPKGHLPPPGECKIWIPGRPPGQQGPPQSCSSALRNAPLGAWVITHEGGRYKVNIFNRNRRNVIDEVRYYLSE